MQFAYGYPTFKQMSTEFFHNWLLLAPGHKFLTVCLNSQHIYDCRLQFEFCTIVNSFKYIFMTVVIV